MHASTINIFNQLKHECVCSQLTALQQVQKQLRQEVPPEHQYWRQCLGWFPILSSTISLSRALKHHRLSLPTYVRLRGVFAAPRTLLWLQRTGGSPAAEHWLSSLGLGNCGLGARQLRLLGSRARAQYLWFIGRAVPRQVGSSQTRDRTRACRTGRRMLSHWALHRFPCSL